HGSRGVARHCGTRRRLWRIVDAPAKRPRRRPPRAVSSRREGIPFAEGRSGDAGALPRVRRECVPTTSDAADAPIAAAAALRRSRMIEAHDLSRRFGDFTAVDGVSFTAADREILGMLGPNGAGKTTTIRMITGFLPPTSGRVTIAGRDLFESPTEVRRHLGYLPENVALYHEMRVEEYLLYRARIEGLAGGEVRTAVGEAVERCMLEEVRHQIIGTISKGFRQRVGLATAILHRPGVL